MNLDSQFGLCNYNFFSLDYLRSFFELSRWGFLFVSELRLFDNWWMLEVKLLVNFGYSVLGHLVFLGFPCLLVFGFDGCKLGGGITITCMESKDLDFNQKEWYYTDAWLLDLYWASLILFLHFLGQRMQTFMRGGGFIYHIN